MSEPKPPTCPCQSCAGDPRLRATHERWIDMMSIMNERQARLYASEKAMEMGRGGIVSMAKITGMSERTIRRGIQELRRGRLAQLGEKARRPGAGRKRVEEADTRLLDALQSVLHGKSAPSQKALLWWTDKSLRSISEDLAAAGHSVSPNSVRRLLTSLGYWRHEGVLNRGVFSAFDAQAQYRYLHTLIKRAVKKRQPVFSIGIGYHSHSGKAEAELSEKIHSLRRAEKRAQLPYRPGVALDCQTIADEYDVKPHGVVDCVVGAVSCWWHSCGQPPLAPQTQLFICLEFVPDPKILCRLQANFGQWAAGHNLRVTISHLPHGLYRWLSVSSQLVTQHQLLSGAKRRATLQTTLRVIQMQREAVPLLPRRQCDSEPPAAARPDHRNLSPHETFPRWNYTLEADGS